MHTSQRKQIRNLLGVLTASVAAAGLISSWMLYHYNPSGIYYAQNVLIAPQLIGSLTYQDLDPKGGKKGKVVFDQIEYAYPEGDKEQKYPVPQNLYETFYDEISPEPSLNPVPDDALAAFHKGKPSKLILKIQNNGKSENFQEVHFAQEGDYYRVQLREGDGDGWVYYHHPGISDKVARLFKANK